MTLTQDTAAASPIAPTAADALRGRTDVRFIDVRTGGEFATSHIPGSFNIPLDTLREHADLLTDLDHEIVLVCQSGNRAGQACTRLAESGMTNLRVLEGGVASWDAAGLDLAHGDTQRWAMDRQVRLVAGSLTLAGVLASVAVPKAKWIAAGIGGGLTFSAITNTCAMANVLGRLQYNRAGDCDIAQVLDDINQPN